MKHFPGSCVLGEKCLRGRGIGLIASELAGRSHGVELRVEDRRQELEPTHRR